MSKPKKPLFITEYKDRLFKVVGGNTIELEDGTRVILNPDMVIDANYSAPKPKRRNK